jgi:hypothetical protein
VREPTINLPPSTTSCALFMYPPAGLARRIQGPAISCAFPNRPVQRGSCLVGQPRRVSQEALRGVSPAGIVLTVASSAPGAKLSVISDGNIPGHMQLTRILSLREDEVARDGLVISQEDEKDPSLN